MFCCFFFFFYSLIIRRKYGGRNENLTKSCCCNWNGILGWDFVSPVSIVKSPSSGVDKAPTKSASSNAKTKVEKIGFSSGLRV